MAGFIQRGLLSPKSVLVAGFACFAAGGGIGIVLCLASGWELFFIGVASALAGFLYTGWPLHLAYIGLGEIVVFFFMGPIIVMGASFVQVEEFTWQAFAASLPIAFLVAAILHANNLRDIEVDRKAQKRTVATVIGRKWANREMYLLLGLTYVALVGAWAVGAHPLAGARGAREPASGAAHCGHRARRREPEEAQPRPLQDRPAPYALWGPHGGRPRTQLAHRESLSLRGWCFLPMIMA
jgi:1,4-dihydroxy-2-naphthoate octaprenyltransferase